MWWAERQYTNRHGEEQSICSSSKVQNDRVFEHLNMDKPQPKAEPEGYGLKEGGVSRGERVVTMVGVTYKTKSCPTLLDWTAPIYYPSPFGYWPLWILAPLDIGPLEIGPLGD